MNIIRVCHSHKSILKTNSFFRLHCRHITTNKYASTTIKFSNVIFRIYIWNVYNWFALFAIFTEPFSLFFVYFILYKLSFHVCFSLPNCLFWGCGNVCVCARRFFSQQHQRIPHPFPHLSLPPPTDAMIDTMTLPPNVSALQQKQHQPFIPSSSQNKYAHMHNVSGFIYKFSYQL